MQKNKKRGFTIVELVIVIAVIAILAAVLIPTFSNIIKKANISSDKQLARNMNAALAAADAEGVVVEDISDVLQIVNAAGYILENLNPSTEGYYFVWDEESNQILFIDNGFNVIFNSKEYSEVKSNWWCTVGSVAEIEKISTAGISLYFEKDITEDLALKKVVGFDTGYFTLTGDLSISGADDVTVVLKGNIVGDVTIAAPSATINQYGSINGSVTVTSGASTSFDIFGYISGMLQALEGHINVENSGNVSIIELPNNTTATVTVSGIVDNLNISGTVGTGATVTVQEGIIQKVTNAVPFTINNNGFIGEVEGADLTVSGNTVNDLTTLTYTLKIATRSQLENFRDMVNGGQTFEGITVELTADIDLSGEPWIPIGIDSRELNTKLSNISMYFSGVFDGKNHKITNLSNEGYNPAGISYATTQLGAIGYIYGLFGCTFNAEIRNVELTNVNIIQLANANSFCSGSLVGASVGSITLYNCKASGNITGMNAIGGLLGYVWNPTKLYANTTSQFELSGKIVLIDHCSFNGNIYATSYRAGGIVGAVLFDTNKNTSITFTNCTVDGSITSEADRVGGLFANSSGTGWINFTDQITIQDNTVNATITAKGGAGARWFSYTSESADAYDGWTDIEKNNANISGNTFNGKVINNDIEVTDFGSCIN